MEDTAMTTSPLTGKIALVTGASRGIGRAIALRLGQVGATVIGTATSTANAETRAPQEGPPPQNSGLGRQTYRFDCPPSIGCGDGCFALGSPRARRKPPMQPASSVAGLVLGVTPHHGSLAGMIVTASSTR